MDALRTSYLDAQPPHLARRAARGRRRASQPRRKLAVPVLVILGVVALALTVAIVTLVNVLRSAGDQSAERPLIVPAPPMAGGLPRHYWPEHNTTTLRLIADFKRRFSAISGSYPGQPAGVYREPGTIDLATGEPGWVMYLGYNSASNLGPPTATVGRVMKVLIAGSALSVPWRSAPGPGGGSAECAIAQFGSTDVSLCAWATERTVGALMSPRADTTGNELAVLMPSMRVDLQQGRLQQTPSQQTPSQQTPSS